MQVPTPWGAEETLATPTLSTKQCVSSAPSKGRPGIPTSSLQSRPNAWNRLYASSPTSQLASSSTAVSTNTLTNIVASPTVMKRCSRL